jgi:glycosyltransferase involved in cell wall biosynthesis
VQDFKVTVVIPVYNTAKYVEEAVASAIQLSQTGEVILIDDGSTDDSLQICENIAMKNHQVRVLRHPSRMNLGAAASRNAGIQAAKFNFISFLDADDYYLPNRFVKDQEIFSANPDIDGVYGCNMAVFENENARNQFLKHYPSERTTISKHLSSNELFKPLLFGGYGRFHTSAITLHKRAFQKSGLFNLGIRYVEDTELWLKLSLKSKLVPGSIGEPISVRRVHETNSIHNREKVREYTIKMYQELFSWALNQDFSFEVKNDFFTALHQFVYGDSYSVKKLFWRQLMKSPISIFSEFGAKKIHLLYFKKH